MEMMLSAVAGEIASRSFSLLMNRCSKLLAPSSTEEAETMRRRLELTLLRLRVAVEEAEGRRITSRAMLRQLGVLRQEMHRGYYVLDRLRCPARDEDGGDDQVSYSYSSLISRFCPGKRPRRLIPRTHGRREHEMMEHMLHSAEITIAGAGEFLILLRNYPPMYRQPYSMYLFVDNCMFGRHSEMEQAIGFLLDKEPIGMSHSFSVLPIIGPAKIGKSTLVEHVCIDERVRDHFSRIILFGEYDLRQKKPWTLEDGVIKHEHSNPNEEKLLVVIDLPRDADEGTWRKLYFASKCHRPSKSKILITSRSDKIAELGTTKPLRLKPLSREEYWYFFKILSFGSLDPEYHPELASIAMEIFDEYVEQDKSYEIIGSFLYSVGMASHLRSSHDPWRWHELHEALKEKHHIDKLLRSSAVRRGQGDLAVSRFLLQKTYGNSRAHCEIYDHCRVGHAQEDDHAIPINKITSREISPQGRFEAILWKSRLPPYYSYIYSCEIHELKCVITTNHKRKVLS